jgi:hypothetical protein
MRGPQPERQMSRGRPPEPTTHHLTSAGRAMAADGLPERPVAGAGISVNPIARDGLLNFERVAGFNLGFLSQTDRWAADSWWG